MNNPIYLPELREMLNENNVDEMQEFCSTLHPARTAEFMVDLEPSEIWEILRHTDLENRAAIFDFFPLQIQVEILEQAPREEFAELLERLPSDNRVDLIHETDAEIGDELLRLLPAEDRHDIRRLQQYPDGSCGSEMSTDFVRLDENMTAEEAIAAIGKQTADADTVYYVYVVDDNDHLVGLVSARQLLATVGKPGRTVREIMKRDLITVGAYDDRDLAAHAVATYNFLAIPVVDKDHRILGIIMHDDVLDVIHEEATEDAHQMAGVMPMEGNYLEIPFFTIWQKRIPWLACLFLAELFTFSALAHFEDAMKQFVILAMFVPLCISTGGNSGSQAATLITRAMALGQIQLRDWLRVFRHEILMGITLGLSLGVIGFCRASLTWDSVLGGVDRWLLAFTIFQAVTAICLFGSVVGAMLPVIFRRLGADPAVASTPFVATFVDVSGIVIYFTIANFWLLSAGDPPTRMVSALNLEVTMTSQTETVFFDECNRFFAKQDNVVSWFAAPTDSGNGFRLTLLVKDEEALQDLERQPEYTALIHDSMGRWKTERGEPFDVRTKM